MIHLDTVTWLIVAIVFLFLVVGGLRVVRPRRLRRGSGRTRRNEPGGDHRGDGRSEYESLVQHR